MEKKLSQDSIGRIDGVIQRFVGSWNDLKRAWDQTWRGYGKPSRRSKCGYPGSSL